MKVFWVLVCEIVMIGLTGSVKLVRGTSPKSLILPAKFKAKDSVSACKKKAFQYDFVNYEFCELSDYENSSFALVPLQDCYMPSSLETEEETLILKPDTYTYTKSLVLTNLSAFKHIIIPHQSRSKELILQITVRDSNCAYLYIKDHNSALDTMNLDVKLKNNENESVFGIKKTNTFQGFQQSLSIQSNKSFDQKISFNHLYVMCPYFISKKGRIEMDLKFTVHNKKIRSSRAQKFSFPNSPEEALDLILDEVDLSFWEKIKKESKVIDDYIKEVLVQADNLIIKIEDSKKSSTQSDENTQVDNTDNVFQSEKVEIETKISKFYFYKELIWPPIIFLKPSSN